MRRHRFDPVSLLFGGLFVLVAIVFLFGDPDLTSVRLQWVWPMGVIVLGGLIILLALSRGRSDEEVHAEPVAAAPIQPGSVAASGEPWSTGPERPSSTDALESDEIAPNEIRDEPDASDRPEIFDDEESFSEERSLP
jgi:hypothetical protein